MLISHSMKFQETTLEVRLRNEVVISDQQFGFLPPKSTIDALFALVLEKYREGQQELHCVFVDLKKKKTYDKVPRENVWYYMRKCGGAEKYTRAVQDMHEGSETVRHRVQEVVLHQGSALTSFLLTMVIDELTDEIIQESPWTMIADDIVI